MFKIFGYKKRYRKLLQQHRKTLELLREYQQDERRRKSWESIRKIILVEPKRQEAREKAEKLGLKVINR